MSIDHDPPLSIREASLAELPAGLPAALTPAEGEAQPWKRYAGSIYRARVPIIILTIIGAISGVVAARYTPLSYRAESTLWVEISDPGEAARGPIRTGQLLQSFGWVELLRSFAVLDHTVRELNLYVEGKDAATNALLSSMEVDERYRPGEYRLSIDSTGSVFSLLTQDGAQIESGRVGTPVGRKIGLQWLPAASAIRPGATYDFHVANIRDRAMELGEALETEMIENSNFLRLSLLGPDAEETARILQFVSERYVEVAAQLKRAKLDELTGVLADQLTYAEENLWAAETGLEEFRIQTITLPSETATPIAPGVQMTRDPVLSSFFDLRIGREEIRSDREALDDILNQVNAGLLTVEAFSAVPSVQESFALRSAISESATKRAELRGLLDRYTEEHERVRRLQTEVGGLDGITIPGLVIQLRDQLMAQERILEDRIQSASVDLEQIPPRAIEEARLLRRVEIANNLHGTLRQRYEEARLATASSIPDLRILDAAVTPGSPLSDRRPLLILLAVIGSFGVGVAGAVGKELLDSRVRYPEQISSRLGIRVIGAVPRLKGGSDNDSQMLEAFREIRLGLAHAHGAAGPMTVTVTSPESGDGKSLIAVNLAMAFALRGDRTLLLDADTRRGTAHRLLEGIRNPGLTNVLAGAATAEEVIQPTGHHNLFLLASGKRSQTAPELLASPVLPALLTHLRTQFDVIVVDSPPMGAGADAYALAAATRDVVVVLRTGVSDGTFAEAKLGIMDRLPVRVLGAVLNDFEPGRLYRYYSYLPGYEATEEPGELMALPYPADVTSESELDAPVG